MNDEQIIQLFFTRNEDAIRQTDDRYGAKLTRLSENIRDFLLAEEWN